MTKFICAIVLFLTCLACEGGIPLSSVEGPVVPAVSELTLSGLRLPEGILSQGISGSNITISEDNIQEVAESLVSMIRMNMSQALTKDTVTGTFDNLFELWDRGDAKLTGTFKAEIDNQDRYNFKGDFTAELNDWTADGEQFFGGGLLFDMTWSATLGATDAAWSTATVSGKVKLGGKYRGTLSFRDFYVLFSSWSRTYHGNIRIEINGEDRIYYLEDQIDRRTDVIT